MTAHHPQPPRQTLPRLQRELALSEEQARLGQVVPLSRILADIDLDIAELEAELEY